MELYWFFITGRAGFHEEPSELAYARSVDLDNLKPFEYDGMSAWEYEKAVVAINAWRTVRERYPKAMESKKTYTPQLTPEYGPQFITDDPELDSVSES